MSSLLNSLGPNNSWGSNGTVSRGRSAPEHKAPLDLAELQAASSILQEKLNKDVSSVPDLGDMLTISGRPSSGSYSVFPDDYRVPFQKRRLLGIPEEVFKYYHTTHHTTHMGFLPDIERVWISIDHQLILWDYVEGQELNTYVEQTDVISHVALVRPKKGIFIDDIQHLIVICTPVSVHLLGVQDVASTSPSGQPRKDLKVYATGMSVSTDVEMTSVIGTAEGRIFMAGAQDGHLYELHYQEKEGWFGKRVQLIDHSVGGMQSFLPKLSAPTASDHILQLAVDLDRQCIYSLTETGIISVYRTNGDKSIECIQTITGIYKSASDKAPGNPLITPSSFKIVAIEVIPPAESRVGIQFVALTSNGIRLFFSSASVGLSYSYGSMNNGRTLNLTHVRMPPTSLPHPDVPASTQSSNEPQSTFNITGVDNLCYSLGVTLCAQPAESDARDFLLCLSPDLTRVGSFGQVNQQPVEPAMYATTSSGPQRNPLVEYASLLPIPGRTWAMAPLHQKLSSGLSAMHELSVQVTEPSRQFMVLTSAGITFLAKRRPLDYLQDVIEEYHADGNVQPLLHFRDSFGREQTCAMLLALACGNSFLELGDASRLGRINNIRPQLVDVAKQAFYDFGERPIFSERMTYGTGDGAGTTLFSGRREGLAFYFARLVRATWKTKVTHVGPDGLQRLAFSEELLENTQKNLQALAEFLERNPQLFHSTSGEHSGARLAAAPEQDAWRLEQQSVSQLQHLLNRASEAISFILLLNDHGMGSIIKKCDAEVQRTVAALTFEDLITTAAGVSASRALVNILIDAQIDHQIGVETVSEVLQSRCGSFCSTDDVMLYKAKEHVRKALESRDPGARQESLADSLRLYMTGARILEFDKLREIVGDYQHLQYAKGAIELPLCCAQIEDSDEQGRTWWLDGSPAGDSRFQAWERRRRCYDLVLDSLRVFDESTAGSSTSNGQAIRTAAYELALQADDEVFHSVFYDWLVERGLTDELLDLRPPYLEAHLQRAPLTVAKYQLLWQFYVKAGQPLRAAEVLGVLADASELNLTLNQRIEYLTLAVGNAKSQSATGMQRLESALRQLTDLEERLEVAQVQLELLNTLMPRINEGGAVTSRIELLQKRLLNITDLYTHYAEPFDLPTIKLLILHVSGHRDDNLAQSVWNQIFEEATEDVSASLGADQIAARIVPLGQRFYPSEIAFPTQHIASLLARFSLAHKEQLAHGWAMRTLVQCGVSEVEVWDLFNEMYESQIPPFNTQPNVQAISSDISAFLLEWSENALRPGLVARHTFPAERVDAAVDQYIAELDSGRDETRGRYERVKKLIRQRW